MPAIHHGSMNTQNTPSFPIFKAGRHVSADGRIVDVSVDDLMEIAQSYDPTFSSAPLVVGHPELDDPAYGWVKSLSVVGDELVAVSENVEAQFAEMVNQRRFPNRSASIYLENTMGNPLPGKKYLKHVGFLGAAAPAIKGLAPVKFNGADAALCFNEPLNPNVSKEKTMDKTPEQIQKEHELTQREAVVAQAEKAIEQHNAKVKRDSAVSFAQGLANDGKLLPAEVAAVTELLLILPESQALTFSEGGTQVSKQPVDVLKGILSALPNRINYAEKSPSGGGEAAIQFSAPVGTRVDASSAVLFAKASAYQNAHPGMDWVDAVRAVGG